MSGSGGILQESMRIRFGKIDHFSDAAQKYDLATGSDSLSPFNPPRQMQCQAASVISLALIAQKKRNQPQRIAEIGVWQGQMSRWLLTCLPHATVHLIDPWQQADPSSTWYIKGDKYAKRPQEQHDIHCEMVRQLCEQFNAGLPTPRAFQHRLASLDAVECFEDGSLDVVFIDGAHNYENVKADILAWRSKVRPGGWLSGHDYKRDGNYFGLVRAVNEATTELGLYPPQVFPGKVWSCRIPA